jgi:hypothetical protein
MSGASNTPVQPRQRRRRHRCVVDNDAVQAVGDSGATLTDGNVAFE